MKKIALALLLTIPGLAGAQPALPFKSDKLHVGVTTCAGSNCHGSTKPFDDVTVLQNEYFTWQRNDAHSNAYKILSTPEGKRIAANLGLKSATDAPECLTCHADFVPAEKRGRRYQLADGVGCEACHGGAEDWLGPHVSGGNTHADNVAAGLYPLEDPQARARLCLHCHLGSAEKPIDHRVMGAGHPPLVFELDTFTAIQPAHYRVDKDYRERKPYTPGLKTWAVGQLAAAEFYLQGVSSGRFKQQGMFPELVFFDCNACHHPMKPPRWTSGVAAGLGPGEARLADAHLVMAGHVLARLAPARAAEWEAQLVKLHAASGQSVERVKEVAGAMREIAAASVREVAGKSVDKADALALIERVAAFALDKDTGDFTAAQQTSMAVDAMVAFIGQEFGVKSEAMKAGQDQVFAAVDTRVNYDPAAFRAGLGKVRAAAAGLK